MHTGEECSPKKKDKSEPSSESDTPKKDKKQESEDPKPRIVLTFRSDKSGAKSSNMKIVSTEEKHEDVTPRRSNRARKPTWESDDDVAISPKKDKTESQQASENDEASDGTQIARRPKRRCNMGTEPITNAIARREQLCKEPAAPATPATRLFRRIKPTPKILENEELRIGLESQNNVRLGITPEKSNEGVKTRRSAHNKSADNQESTSPETKHLDESKADSSKNDMKKLKHLCELGLKSVTPKKSDDDYDNRNAEGKEEEDEEIDDDTEVISKLLQEDSSSEPESGVSEIESIDKNSKRNTENDSEESEDEPNIPLRRSKRSCCRGDQRSSYYLAKWANMSSGDEYEPAPKKKSRRTLSDKASNVNSTAEEEPEEKNEPAGADEGSAPASPAASNKIVGQCCCEATSNIYAAPTDLPDPVFCQAIESVEGMRVGCSHGAGRDARGELLPLLRCGPRAPYLLACRLHAAQLRQHMCCPLCGLFCTQGEFYQCSEGHLFHIECALPREMTDQRHRSGCPHCGVRSYYWAPVNTTCHRVRVDMHVARPVYLPDQREQSTPAFLGFTKLDPAKLDHGPLIPEDLLPPLVDIKQMCETAEGGKSVQELYDAIVAGERLEQIIPKLVGVDVNEVTCAGESCAHAAASGGRADVLYALRCAGADLDAADKAARTPLMRAIQALLENEPVEEPEEPGDDVPHDKVQEGGEKEKDDVKEKEDDKHKEEAEDKADVREQDLMRVIKFLVAAGCDVNVAGPEGMSALHVSAGAGGAAVCALLLGAGAAVDARDHGGWTPLVRAAENGHAACVKVLLGAGADAGATDGEGHGALHWCALAGRARCLRLLLAAAPHLASAPNRHADTPLHVAAREGHYACVIILLAHGARTDMENSAGELAVEVCGGRCRAAISLNMQVACAAKGTLHRHKMLSSDISNGREPWGVECVNEVDDATLPADFTYTAQLVTPAPLQVDCTLATMQGCACDEGLCDGGACACAALGVRAWYVRGRLPAAFPYHDPPMLFECNNTCACNMKRCGNRVVSRLAAAGSIGARVQVFRTARCGWGLRARTAIKRGGPVALYTGELLARHDADARANDQYMFALDLKQDLLQGEGEEAAAEEEALCVDAARWGGAARFINHSCAPNVAPVRVYTHTRDLRLPTVALFALRDISAMEEITFDYGDKFWSVKSKFMKCECESPECRYPTKTEEETA
ncbi:histone-lysine N-methyltransferase EHMT2 isoform X2 [Aricia agestis]|uniref:histone-lysine N-methyltransferase EHMT2 isoform X2 n=1 Tax=Aricia agestis TaxID=91739 RepID=UPI001C2041E3|nr:histone-lysine N-methyltransferase EHMT2 isoform X2 [Aricia agestis]